MSPLVTCPSCRARSRPRTRREVVEANQIHVFAATMLRDREQILHVHESGLARQVVGGVVELDRLDRVGLDLTFIHGIAPADLDVGVHPDADAAPDSPAADPFAKALGEDHSGSLRPSEFGSVKWLERV